MLAEATKGWFLSARRDQKTGGKVVYYDEHGLDQQRAYQIVCLMVGSDKDKFKDLARETKLPRIAKIVVRKIRRLPSQMSPSSRSACLLGCSASQIIHRTAVYGPVGTVVWEGRRREAPPYPDFSISCRCGESGRRGFSYGPLPHSGSNACTQSSMAIRWVSLASGAGRV